jgi:hypothetical protein
LRNNIRTWLSLFMLVLLFTAISCRTPDSPQASLGREFTLQIGQEAVIVNESLTIKFAAVTEDSRCPKGVTCIWAGRAVSKLEIVRSNQSSSILLEETGGTDGYSTMSYELYRLQYRIEPYPEAGKPIEARDYRLLLTVSKP